MQKNIKLLVIAITLLFLLYVCFACVYFYINNGKATLSWDANTESNLAGYKIYYGASPRNNDCPPGGYENSIDAGKTTKYNINNLTKGKTYYFSITSYNNARKESCFSREVKKAILYFK